jgi:hypothetical protein
VESGEAPEWPLGNCTTDETNLREITDRLGLDRRGYDKAVRQALDLTASRRYERLHAAVSHALARHGALNEQALTRIKAVTEEEMMLYTKIVRGAFQRSIDRWRASGKRIPLHWDHKADAANVIGSIDPAMMRETNDGSTSKASSTSRTAPSHARHGARCATTR